MGFSDYQDGLEQDIRDLNEGFVEAEIDEAFGKGDLKKVSDLLARIASKKLGAKFQPGWDESFIKSSGKKGIGHRYVSVEGQSIRFNHVVTDNSFAVNSVDYWKKGAPLLKPSMTIYFEEGINIVQLTDELFTAIKTGKVPAIDLTEATAKEKEAKRLEFAGDHGIKASYAGTNSQMIKKATKMGILDQYNKWMEIKTNDMDKTVLGDKIAREEKMFNSGAFYADPKYIFEDISEGAMLIAKGLWRSLVITGMAGMGKTFGVKQVLTQFFGASVDGPSGKWIFKTGEKASTFGMFKTLLLNKNKIVVYDDSDSIWRDKDTINLLKSATADDGERWISWGSGATANVDLMSKQAREDYEEEYIISVMEDPNTKMKPPSKFLFTGAFINISNLPTSAFAKGDLSAISSRSIFIDVKLAQADALRRIATILAWEGRSEEKITAVLDVLDPPKGSDAILSKGKYDPKVMGKIQYMTSEEARKTKTINMRSANIVLAMMDGDVKNFERMAGLYS